ncbi:MAG: hypothetical protein ACKVOR_01400 [Flavobacteriales bacterium]
MPGRLLKYLIVSLTILVCQNNFAQEDVKAVVHGILKNDEDHQRMAGVNIRVFRNGQPYQNLKTDNLGKYELVLELGHSYEIRFEQADFVTKSIVVDTQGIPETARNTSFDLLFDGELFKAPPDFNKDVVKDPVAIAKFVGSKGKIVVDEGHAEKRKEEIKDEFERLKSDPKLAQEQYDALVKEGDALMADKNWGGAADKYQAALKKKPHTEPAKGKYADAKAKYDAEQDAKNREEKYALLIKDGDAAIASEKWAEAKTKFTEANKMKPKETHPKEMMALCDKNLTGDKAKAEYDRLVKDADNKMAGKFYKLAIDQYNAALKQLPSEQYPKDKIADCQKLIDDALKTAEIDGNYQRTKDDADEKLRLKKYEEAITLYEKAKTIKPQETYPDQQITKANDLIKERDYLILKKKYDDIIAKGDTKYNTKDFEGSIPIYEQAKALLPKEAMADQKIGAANKAIADRDEAKKRKEYTDLVAKADGQFKTTDYENAIGNYEEALKLYPSEVYPSTQVNESKRLLAEKLKKENQKAYDALVAKATALFDTEKFEECMPVYEEAQKLLPSEKYPTTQIEKAKAGIIKRDEKKLRAQYDAIVQQGDGLMKAEKYEDAITKFNDALGVLPSESYPKDQITKAQEAITKRDEKKLRGEFDVIVAQADQQFNSSEYEKSIDTYNKALALLPSEKYPKAQIEKAIGKLDAAKAEQLKREQYEELIRTADLRLNDAAYEEAITNYKAALELYPKELHPKNQIKLAEAGIAAWKQKKADFDKLIAKADAKFKDEKWKESIDMYSQASIILPNEQYPKDQIIEATAKVDAVAAEALRRKQYEEVIADADNKYNNRDYQMALDQYKKAADMYTEEEYPKARIEKCLLMLNAVNEPVVELEPKEKKGPELKVYKQRELSRYDAYIMKQLAKVEEKKAKDREFHKSKTGSSMTNIAERNKKLQVEKENKAELAEPEIVIVDEKSYKKGNGTITEITIRNGQLYSTYMKSAYKFATYYQEINTQTGTKVRDLTAAEWKRVTGKDPDK